MEVTGSGARGAYVHACQESTRLLPPLLLRQNKKEKKEKKGTGSRRIKIQCRQFELQARCGTMLCDSRRHVSLVFDHGVLALAPRENPRQLCQFLVSS
jgi:hypothetical protein